DRSLEPVPVDVLGVLDVGSLLLTQPEKGSLAEPLVEVDLAERVLQPEGVAAVDRAPRARLADDVGRDPEADQVMDLPRDVDVGPADVEGARIELVAVHIDAVRLDLIGVV